MNNTAKRTALVTGASAGVGEAFARAYAQQGMDLVLKAFLIKFSESLSQELAGTGVNVTASCPGLTYSEFHDVLGNRAQVSKMPRYAWMDADEVAEASIAACERRDPVYVTGRVNQAIAGLLKLVPHRLSMMMSARQSKRFRAQE